MIKKILAGAAAALVMTTSFAADITGAGATFPYPIYAKWAESYKAATGNGLNYQSVGSGAGIKQIKAKTVDFGASDMPLKAEDLESDGLMQFPAIMGGVVAVVNVEGVTPGHRRYLPGQDRQVERGRDRGPEPGREAAGRRHHRRAPRRQLGHLLPVHRLPVQG